MNYYNKTNEPDLVETVVVKKINKFIAREKTPTLMEYIKMFLSNYIYPYSTFIIFFSFIGIFLYYRYNMTLELKKKEKRQKKIDMMRKEYIKNLFAMLESSNNRNVINLNGNIPENVINSHANPTKRNTLSAFGKEYAPFPKLNPTVQIDPSDFAK